MSSIVSSASSCSIEAEQQLESTIPSSIQRISATIYSATPVWLRNVSFSVAHLVALPFTQGLMFALGLYIGKTMFVRPLMARFRIKPM